MQSWRNAWDAHFIRLLVCVFVCVLVHAYVCVYMVVRMLVCVCVYIYIYVYKHTQTCIHTCMPASIHTTRSVSGNKCRGHHCSSGQKTRLHYMRKSTQPPTHTHTYIPQILLVGTSAGAIIAAVGRRLDCITCESPSNHPPTHIHTYHRFC